MLCLACFTCTLPYSTGTAGIYAGPVRRCMAALERGGGAAEMETLRVRLRWKGRDMLSLYTMYHPSQMQRILRKIDEIDERAAQHGYRWKR